MQRLARRAKHILTRTPTEAADIVPLPKTSPALDKLLTGLGGLDDRVLGRRNLPFGSSVVVAARKPIV